MLLTRLIKIQLVVFAILTVIALVALGWYYLRLPRLAGVNQYTLYADLERSGGLYRTANVTYRGIAIGRVTAVDPTETGARVTMSIDDHYKIPIDASADVHSVTAVGEQYVDLVSKDAPKQYFASGDTITKSSVPDEVGPALDATDRALKALPKEQIDVFLDETSQAVAGLGPALQRLVDSTTLLATDFRDNIDPINDIIANSGPILNSQVVSGDAIDAWARNLNILGAQAAEQDAALRSGLQQAAPTAQQVEAVFAATQESLPQTLANLSVIIDLLKRYDQNIEMLLVGYPQGASVAQAGTAPFPNIGILPLALSINQPPPCLTGFLPAPMWRSPADTSTGPTPQNLYCKIPKDYQANVVRGARNYPCADVPGKRAAFPQECRSDEPYVPAGTNPWYGDPNQILTCPAPGARCDQPPKPGYVIPAPSINNGLNPAPASDLPPAPQAPSSDPVTPPGTGSVRCTGQQPNQCTYVPDGPPAEPVNIFAPPGPPPATYSPQSGQVVTPDGTRLSVTDATTGDDGWKDLLAPTG